MSLYKKYRPKDFDEIIGNEVTIKSLKSVLNRNKEDIPHVFLLTGYVGTGKTTIARIIAKKLNCHKNDLIEMDVGSNRSVEDADLLKKKIRFRPSFGQSRVYIIDEIQIATRGNFQSSLLKTMEDGSPSYVYFILCTTDPQLINKGIKSRSAKFAVSKLSAREIIQILKRILSEEKKEISSNILRKIADVVDGTPRDALVLLDQIIDLGDESDMEKVINSFQSGSREVIELCRALIYGKAWSVVAKIIKEIKEDPEKVRHGVLGYCNAVLLNTNSNKKIDKDRAALIIEYFNEPFFYSGKALLTSACYQITMD